MRISFGVTAMTVAPHFRDALANRIADAADRSDRQAGDAEASSFAIASIYQTGYAVNMTKRIIC
jgi:hypothetical protein